MTWTLAGALLCAAPAEALADAILVGAPVFNNFSSWVSQTNVPPSGLVFNHAAEFALTSAQMVTEIEVSLYGSATVTPAPFEFALVDSLTSVTPIQSAVFNAPGNNSIAGFSLPINSMLAAGTYYIRLTTSGFYGWPVADATQFVTAHGTIADGIWQQSPSTGTWNFQGSGGNTSIFFPHPGVFSVLGPSEDTEVPEPASGLLFVVALGLLGTLAAYRNCFGRKRNGFSCLADS